MKQVLIISLAIVAFVVFHYSRQLNQEPQQEGLATQTENLEEETDAGKIFEEPTECDFSGEFELFGAVECSPEIVRQGFLGLVIYASQEDSIKDFSDPEQGVMPYIFGTFIVGSDQKELQGDEIEIVAQHKQSGKTFKKRLGQMDENSEDESEAFDLDQLDHGHQGFFNPNLLEIIDVPKPGSQYEVHAQLGTYTSNKVTITFK